MLTVATKPGADIVQIQFRRPFELKDYEIFLNAKSLPEQELAYDEDEDCYWISTPKRFAHLLGIEVKDQFKPGLSLPDFLFPHQVSIVQMALKAKRFAVWAQMGLGKTLIEAEFARQVAHMTSGKVLIFSLNEIVPQFIKEVDRFYQGTFPIQHITSRSHLIEWATDPNAIAVAITNYEKMNPKTEGDFIPELKLLGGIVLDESSRLKGENGKQRLALVESCKGIPFKLTATATPAPNDVVEFQSQAQFLETTRSGNDIIWTFFTRDKHTQAWTIKKHAQTAFFEWMSGWSIYLKDPARFGWQGFTLPPDPQFIWHKLEATEAQKQAVIDYQISLTDQLLMFGNDAQGIVGRSKLSQIGKGFIYTDNGTFPVESPKPGFIADLIRQESNQHQVLVWTVFDEESTIIQSQLDAIGFDSYAILSGKVNRPKRADIISRFLEGELKCLISKPSLLGYGMNFQNCGSMIFSGWTDSFEMLFQSIGRAVRFGQTKPVRIHLPYIPDFEGAQLQNVFRKMEQFNEITARQEASYIKAMQKLNLLEKTHG